MSWLGGQTQRYEVYIDGYDLLGVASFTPPECTQKTVTLGGSGVLGEIELPAFGLYEKLEGEIKFTSISQPAFRLINLNGKLLEFKAIVNGLETTTHATDSRGLYFAVRGTNKSFAIGEIKAGELIETSFKMEFSMIEARLNGEKLFKIDKLNGIVEQLGLNMMKKISEMVF